MCERRRESEVKGDEIKNTAKKEETKIGEGSKGEKREKREKKEYN